MPRTIKRRYRKRKPVKKKRSNILTTSSLSVPIRSYPIGKSKRMTTRYVQFQQDLTPGAVLSDRIWSLNGLYDPDISATMNHQPLGFDQFMLMYDHYTVLAARVRVVFINKDTSDPALVAIQVKDTANITDSLSESVENGLCRWAVVSSAGTGGDQKTLSLSVDLNDFFSTNVRYESKYSGTSAGNPSDQCYLHCIAAPAASAGNVSGVAYQICIEYDVLYDEPKQLDQS